MSGYDTNIVCRLLKVSKSAYYSHKTKRESDKTEEEKLIIHYFEKHHGNYGRKRIRKDIIAIENKVISEGKISRILRENGLVAKVGRKKKKKVAKPTDEQITSENLIKDKFKITMKNVLWCTDLSEFKYAGGKLYVSAIIDVATRRIVAAIVSKNCRQELVQDTIKMACEQVKLPKGAVFHSDRGCQYTAKKTKQLIEEYGFKVSMSRPGTPSDNQPIESFWKTIKTEMPDIRHLGYEKAEQTILEYIYIYYNGERLHSSINYQTPNSIWM